MRTKPILFPSSRGSLDFLRFHSRLEIQPVSKLMERPLSECVVSSPIHFMSDMDLSVSGGNLLLSPALSFRLPAAVWWAASLGASSHP